VSPAKTAEPSEMPFGLRTWFGGPKIRQVVPVCVTTLPLAVQKQLN